MNNFEKIKTLGFDETLNFLLDVARNSCKICSAREGYNCTIGGNCERQLVKQWLESEEE